MKWEGNDVIYNCHIKKDVELYVTSEALVAVGKHESGFSQMSIKMIRCALPFGEMIKLFWRRPGRLGGESEDRWIDGKVEFVLDLKKMYPDRKERNNAKKTEATRLAMIILKTAQDAYTGNTPIPNDCLAMHANEHLVKSYKCFAKGAYGKLYITNLGVYFVVNGIGLAFSMSFEYISGATHDAYVIKLYFLVPKWVNRLSNRDTNTFVIRIMGDGFTEAHETISKILEAKKRSYPSLPNNPFDDSTVTMQDPLLPDKPSGDSSATIQNPLDVLKMKLVNDEITKEEYEKKKKILTD